MVSEDSLNMIRLAFIQLSETTDLGGWQLDPWGWNYNGSQETDDTDIHILRANCGTGIDNHLTWAWCIDRKVCKVRFNR